MQEAHVVYQVKVELRRHRGFLFCRLTFDIDWSMTYPKVLQACAGPL